MLQRKKWLMGKTVRPVYKLHTHNYVTWADRKACIFKLLKLFFVQNYYCYILDENYKVMNMFSPRSQDYGNLDNLDNIIGKIMRVGPTIRKVSLITVVSLHSL